MKKTLLAAAIPALMMATSASAVELYNDGANSVSMGGHASVQLQDVKDGDTKVADNSPRINFAFNRVLSDDLTLEVKTEWGMNFVDNQGDMFFNRLGYIGLTSEKYGQVRAGQQWGVFGDVALAADMPIIFGNGYLYTDHDNLGIARASSALAYRKGFDLGDAGSLNVGVQFQGAQGNYDDRFAVSVKYQLMGASIGYALSQGDFTEAGQTVEKDVDAIAFTYGKYGKEGVYVGANYSTSTNVFGAGEGDSTAYDAMVSYSTGATIFDARYESVENDDAVLQADKVDTEYAALVVTHNVVKNLAVYGGYMFDLETDHSDDTSSIVVGARVYF